MDEKTLLDLIAPMTALRELWYEVAPPIGGGSWRPVIVASRKPQTPKGTDLDGVVFKFEFEPLVSTPYMPVIPGTFYLGWDGFCAGRISWMPNKEAVTLVVPFRCGTKRAGEVLAKHFLKMSNLRWRRGKTLVATPENWYDYVYDE